MRRTINNRVLGVGGLLLLLPVGLSVILSLSKHEGAIVPSHPATKVVDAPLGFMADIPSGANSVLVKYVDALTTGLHTGSAVAIKEVTDPGCECRMIGESFEAIYTKANLVGGAYSLKRSTVVKKSDSEIQLKVVIHMSDTTHIVRKTGVKEVWTGTDISAYFTLVNRNAKWTIHSTAVML